MKLLCVVICCLFSLLSSAQKGVVKGLVKDSASGQPLSLASVAVYTAMDPSLLTYHLSEPSGKFEIKGIPYHRLYRLVISYQGYKIFRKEFELTTAKPTIDFDTLRLAEDAKALEEILISAERPPMMMRNDTLEFNANAFKTLPSALVEDLLKKLPGVDVDMEGNIIVNGRRVNRLLVDGKEFFGSDYRIATRNLPANIVDKVQVVDDAEQKIRNPNLKAYQLGQVVNIKLKKAIRKGWFGKVYGGIGTNQRHEAGGIVNLFRDTVQVSVLGFSNNVNKQGFDMNDLQNIGGGNRGGNSMMHDFSNGGIEHSRGGGLNFNTELGKQVSLNLNYIYKQKNSLNEWKTFTQQFFGDTILLTPSYTRSEQIAREHKVGGQLRWKPSPNSTVEFSPSLSIGTESSGNINSSSTTDNFKGFVNRKVDQSSYSGSSHNYSHSFSFSFYSDKKNGYSFNISQNTNTGNTANDNFRNGIYTFFSNTIGRDSLLNLLQATDNTRFNHSFSVNISKKFATRHQLTLRHKSEYKQNANGLNFFNQWPGTNSYTLYNDLLSNSSSKQGWEHSSTADVSFNFNSWSFSPSLNLQWVRHNNEFTKARPIFQRLFFISPSLEVRWKSLSFRYSQDVLPPEAEQLRPIIDISDPLYKYYGNPDLRPEISRQGSLHFYHYFQKSQSFLNFSVSVSQQKNGIIALTFLDSNRATISRPSNINGVGYYSINSEYNRRLNLTKGVWISLRAEVEGDVNNQFLSINSIISKAIYKTGTANLSLSLNYKDLIELSQRYRLTLRQSRFEDKKNYRDVNAVSHQLESSVVVRWPKRMVWENQINYLFNPEVGRGIRSSMVRWNANLYYAFTKDEKIQGKLSVYDLLNQNINLYRYTYEGFISDGQALTLKRYSMLSIVYNIRYFGGTKPGQTQTHNY